VTSRRRGWFDGGSCVLRRVREEGWFDGGLGIEEG